MICGELRHLKNPFIYPKRHNSGKCYGQPSEGNTREFICRNENPLLGFKMDSNGNQCSRSSSLFRFPIRRRLNSQA